MKQTLDLSLGDRGMLALLVAQFLSALADNAILIVAIALLKQRELAQLVPFLQAAFVAPFIVLAPFVGQIADSFPKGRVMLWANALKLGGAVAMTMGANPFVAYGAIGIGAAIYSPAKYGILAQMFVPARLVRANGALEGSTIVAILLGVLLGGWIADHSLAWAFGGVIGAYAVAAVANLAIPRLPAENAVAGFLPLPLVRRFVEALKRLVGNPDARFSLAGTSVFWGCGATLRLLLFAWVPAVLAIDDNQTPANLMGMVSFGIVLGAAAAGAWISLANVNRALIGGLLLGPSILALAAVGDLYTAALLMAVTGLCGGLFVVPLNALLQQRGHESVGAGNALAVQNFFENFAMLLFVGGYSAANAAGISVFATVEGFGLMLVAAIGAMALSRLRH